MADGTPANVQPKKPVWKRWWFIASAIFVAIIIALASGSPEKTGTPTAQDTPSDQVTDDATGAESPVESPPAPPPTAPSSRFKTFEDGTYTVPGEIKYGTYRTRVGSDGCYWAKLKNFDGDIESINANDNTSFPAVVTITKKDKGFETTDCGEWTSDLSAITTSRTRFGDGDFIVKTDMKPGTYKSSGGEGCYWARLKDFTHGIESINANDNTDRPAIVTIKATDKGFESKDCGTWKRIG